MSDFLPPQGSPIEGLPPPIIRSDSLGHIATSGGEALPPSAGSYENGWGFFDEGNSLKPDEFTLTRNDDLYVDSVILGLERQDQFSSVDRQMPFNPERRRIAEEGICRAIEAKWQLSPGMLTDIRTARNYLQQAAVLNSDYTRRKNAIHYQNISMIPRDGSTLGDKVEGYGDFLHFGHSSRSTETATDKLDNIMRVYVHTPPEYNGHIAAELINEVRKKLGRELYLKLDDCSTSGKGSSSARIDGLIIYAQTHAEMVVVAETLRNLSAQHPKMFDAKANQFDVARETDIPGVSLAEEPNQNNAIQQSFNESRHFICQDALKAVYRRYLQKNPHLAKEYRITDSDIEFFPHIIGSTILRERYKKMDATSQLTFHDALKKALRKEAQKLLDLKGVDPNNFAMNKR